MLLTFDGVFMGATLELNGHRLATTTDPLIGNVTGFADQFLRYSFPVGRLLLGTSPNVLTVTFGVLQNENPGVNGGGLKEHHRHTPPPPPHCRMSYVYSRTQARTRGLGHPLYPLPAHPLLNRPPPHFSK